MVDEEVPYGSDGAEIEKKPCAANLASKMCGMFSGSLPLSACSLPLSGLWVALTDS
jgi:hypothetical protein